MNSALLSTCVAPLRPNHPDHRLLRDVFPAGFSLDYLVDEDTHPIVSLAEAAGWDVSAAQMPGDITRAPYAVVLKFQSIAIATVCFYHSDGPEAEAFRIKVPGTDHVRMRTIDGLVRGFAALEKESKKRTITAAKALHAAADAFASSF